MFDFQSRVGADGSHLGFDAEEQRQVRQPLRGGDAIADAALPVERHRLITNAGLLRFPLSRHFFH